MTTALNRWQSETPVSLRDAVNQLFEDSFVRPFGGSGGNGAGRYLPLDIYETDETFVVKAFVPGITADKLDVTTQQQTVTIRAEQPAPQQEGVHYHLRERSGGPLVRSFELPVPIDASRIDAHLQDGVLTLTLPKAPEAKPYKVQVKAA